jgi:pimeloyl-ACP methyl ester carboxylesterase
MEKVLINDQPFAYRTWGDPSNPLLLFLHGFPEYSGAWADVASQLIDQYYCVAPDQRGYGHSWRPTEVSDYVTSKLVEDVVGLIDHIGRPFAVVGHDWGASVSYALAIMRPDLVERLIIMNGVHPIPFQRELLKGDAQTKSSQYIHFLRAEGSEGVLAKDGFAKLIDLFSAKMDLSWMTPEVREAYMTAWRDEAGLGAMINWYRASPLVVAKPDEPVFPKKEFDPSKLRITMPHLLIWGQDDTALLPVSYEGLEDLCEDLTITKIVGADHWLHHQKPVEVAEIMRDWLAAAVG